MLFNYFNVMSCALLCEIKFLSLASYVKHVFTNKHAGTLLDRQWALTLITVKVNSPSGASSSLHLNPKLNTGNEQNCKTCNYVYICMKTGMHLRAYKQRQIVAATCSTWHGCNYGCDYVYLMCIYHKAISHRTKM